MVDEVTNMRTRPDTRLPQSRAGGQGPYLRSLDRLGRISESKNNKVIRPKSRASALSKNVRQTDGQTIFFLKKL